MENVRSVFRIINHVGYILSKRQKRASIVVFVSMVINASLELLGVSLIYPFLQLIIDVNTESDSKVSRIINMVFPYATWVQKMIYLGLTIAMVYLVKNAMAVICSYIQSRYTARVNRELQVKVMEACMKRPYEYFVNTDSSIVMRGMQGDVSAVYNILTNMLQIIVECMSILLIFIYLVSVDPFITIVSMLMAAGCFVGITFGFKGVMKRLGAETRKLEYTSSGHIYRTVTGIKEIIVLERRRYFVDRFNDIGKELEKKNIKTSVINAIPDRALEGLCMVCIMVVLCIRIARGVNVEAFIPVMGSFAMAVFRIMPSISRIANKFNNMVYFMPGLSNAYDIVKDAENIDQKIEEDRIILAKQLKGRKLDDFTLKQDIRINDVFWKYKNGVDDVLKGVSLTIKRGESVGFIGTSGGGKSTLVDILMGLFKPQKGSIEADGIDIFLMKQRWRRIIGYVPQSIFLTDDSIKENVAFGLPEKEISEEKVWRALKKAQLATFVETLPNGLDTLVGERGVKVSGGQRQRIAIARALYDDPEILILDEATAALDNETEKAFMDAIELLRGQKTIILIAHRLTTVKNCDRVYEVKGGVAVERDVNEVIAQV